MKGLKLVFLYFLVFLLSTSFGFCQFTLKLDSSNAFIYKRIGSDLFSLKVNNQLNNQVNIIMSIGDYKTPTLAVVNSDTLIINGVLVTRKFSSIRKNKKLVGLISVNRNKGIINLHDRYWQLSYNKKHITLDALDNYGKLIHRENSLSKTIAIKRLLNSLEITTSLDEIPVELLPLLSQYDLKRSILFSENRSTLFKGLTTFFAIVKFGFP